MYQQVNLYQPIFRRQRQIFSAQTILAVIGLVGAALLTVYAYGLVQVIALEAEIAQLEERERAYSAQLARLDPSMSEERRRAVDAELEKLNDALRHQQQLIDVLREQPLGSTAGFSAELAALARQHGDGLWLTRIAIAGDSSRMELAGRSVSPELIPRYLKRLGKESALAGQRFDLLEIERVPEDEELAFRVSSKSIALDAERHTRRGR